MENYEYGRLPAEGYVRLSQVLEVLSIGRSTWWKGIKDGKFPKPVKLGARTSRWRVEEIRALLASFSCE